MKYTTGLMVLIGVIVILGGLAAMMDGITDFRTDMVSDSFILATNASATTGGVQLTETLWEGATVYATVASNLTSDTPVMSSYTAANRQLNLGGLATNTSRLMTVEYRTAGLSSYSGADTGIRLFPVLLVLGCLGLVAAAIIYVLQCTFCFPQSLSP